MYFKTRKKVTHCRFLYCYHVMCHCALHEFKVSRASKIYEPHKLKFKNIKQVLTILMVFPINSTSRATTSIIARPLQILSMFCTYLLFNFSNLTHESEPLLIRPLFGLHFAWPYHIICYPCFTFHECNN